MSFDIPDAERRDIESFIHSESSPVGIDAKRTHVLILHKLIQIEKRLDRLEQAHQEADREA